MPGIEPQREWQRLVDEYNAACAAFDAANRVIASAPTYRMRAAETTLAAAEIAEDEARRRLLAVRRHMRDFDPDHPESLPIG